MRTVEGSAGRLAVSGLLCLGLWMAGQSLFGQRAPQPLSPPAMQMPAATPNDTLKSFEVMPDRRVRFRLWAPNATDVNMEDRLHAYPGGIAHTNRMHALAIGGTSDHVHLLLSLPGTVSISKSVQLLKSGSSKWVHETFPNAEHFSWQEGYGAFSIGVSQRAATVKYIQSQHEHHRRITFEDELNKFLAVHVIHA